MNFLVVLVFSLICSAFGASVTEGSTPDVTSINVSFNAGVTMKSDAQVCYWCHSDITHSVVGLLDIRNVVRNIIHGIAVFIRFIASGDGLLPQRLLAEGDETKYAVAVDEDITHYELCDTTPALFVSHPEIASSPATQAGDSSFSMGMVAILSISIISCVAICLTRLALNFRGKYLALLAVPSLAEIGLSVENDEIEFYINRLDCVFGKPDGSTLEAETPKPVMALDGCDFDAITFGDIFTDVSEPVVLSEPVALPESSTCTSNLEVFSPETCDTLKDLPSTSQKGVDKVTIEPFMIELEALVFQTEAIEPFMIELEALVYQTEAQCATKSRFSEEYLLPPPIEYSFDKTESDSIEQERDNSITSSADIVGASEDGPSFYVESTEAAGSILEYYIDSSDESPAEEELYESSVEEEQLESSVEEAQLESSVEEEQYNLSVENGESELSSSGVDPESVHLDIMESYQYQEGSSEDSILPANWRDFLPQPSEDDDILLESPVKPLNWPSNKQSITLSPSGPSNYEGPVEDIIKPLNWSRNKKPFNPEPLVAGSIQPLRWPLKKTPFEPDAPMLPPPAKNEVALMDKASAALSMPDGEANIPALVYDGDSCTSQTSSQSSEYQMAQTVTPWVDEPVTLKYETFFEFLTPEILPQRIRGYQKLEDPKCYQEFMARYVYMYKHVRHTPTLYALLSGLMQLPKTLTAPGNSYLQQGRFLDDALPVIENYFQFLERSLHTMRLLMKTIVQHHTLESHLRPPQARRVEQMCDMILEHIWRVHEEKSKIFNMANEIVDSAGFGYEFDRLSSWLASKPDPLRECVGRVETFLESRDFSAHNVTTRIAAAMRDIEEFELGLMDDVIEHRVRCNCSPGASLGIPLYYVMTNISS